MDFGRDGGLRQIGPYRLIKQLGSGGMGRVYLGRSRGGRAVAVKVVHAELAGDAEFRRRFAAEVAAARQVGGFYTAQVVDADTDADPPWSATAYIPGPSLAEAVTEHGPLPATAVRVLGAGLAEGLAAIHGSGLVHRDLTHRNVILADDGPRVIDFGIAKALDTVHLSTRVIGTPGFMSPEQARAGEIGPESDVFSLGCVLTYAATGTGPFGGGRAELVVYRIVHEEPDLGGAPAAIAGLLRACLAKNPAHRPTLDEVLDQLELPATGITTAGWLPSDVTAMIDERGALIRTPSSAPQASGPTRVETVTAVHDDRVATPPRLSLPVAAPDGGARQPIDHPSQAAPATVRAAIALALLCLPGLLARISWLADRIEYTMVPPVLMRTNLVLTATEAVVLTAGALLLGRRRRAGRWMIAVTGGTTALHGLSAGALYLLMGAESLPPSISTLISLASPLTAVAAAAAALMAVLPSTGRWCHRRQG